MLQILKLRIFFLEWLGLTGDSSEVKFTSKPLTLCFSSQALFKIRGRKGLPIVLIDPGTCFLLTFDVIKWNATVCSANWSKRLHRCGNLTASAGCCVPVSVHLFHFWYFGVAVGEFLRKYKKDPMKRIKHLVKIWRFHCLKHLCILWIQFCQFFSSYFPISSLQLVFILS